MEGTRLKDSPVRVKAYIAGLILFLTGLVSSKALISLGSVILIGTACWGLFSRPSLPVRWPKQLFGFVLLFLPPFISGIWSASVQDWMQVSQNKIMLPALFASFCLAPGLEPKTMLRLGLFQAMTVVLASWYSMLTLWPDPSGISSSYLEAKTLKVFLSNDHLHFSLYVFITILLLLANLNAFRMQFGKGVYLTASIGLAWLVIYLHILGAKTGLLLLYLTAFIYLIMNYLNGKQWLRLGAGFIVLFLLASLSISQIPTLKNRFYYTLYDFNQYMHGAYIDGLTDGARVLSWKAGKAVALESPWMGKGFGDLHHTFMKWHQAHSAQLQPYNWLQPSNEWLMYLCGSGIPGMLILTLGLWLIYRHSPFREHFLFLALYCSQVLMMFYEVNLTNQIGISLLVFSVGWFQCSPSPGREASFRKQGT